MNILILNGSPRKAKSNTLKITNAFLEGLVKHGTHETTTIDVAQKNIEPCLGCFACWKDTPGVCVINDDMTDILPLLIKADLVIWSFPLYYFSMPSKIKALMDRMLPLNLPFIEEKPEGGATHPSRYDLSHQRTVLISTCGFFTKKNNYEALESQFDIAFGKNNVTKIICPQGELFSQPQLRRRTDEYLVHVRNAGAEYAKDNKISNSTQAELSQLLYPKETYMTLANASWGIEKEPSEKLNTKEEKTETDSVPAFSFLTQMATLYNPEALRGKEAILEFYFTDLDITYRLHLGNTTCTVLNEETKNQAISTFLPKNLSATRIETPFSVWQKIGNGELDGSTAMMQGMYRVLGNFDLMLKMDDLFAGPKGSERENADTGETSGSIKKPMNMALVILPWMPLWIALPFNSVVALLVSLAGLTLFQLAGFKWEISTHERIGFALVSLFTLAMAAGVDAQILMPLSYAAFGSQWLISCFFHIPLTAVYSSAGYGGDAAFNNPLFMRTNRIITAVWGVFYLATAIWTVFLLMTPLAHLSGAINSIMPALCGLWTAWFQKYYPAKIARGK